MARVGAVELVALLAMMSISSSESVEVMSNIAALSGAFQPITTFLLSSLVPFLRQWRAHLASRAWGGCD